MPSELEICNIALSHLGDSGAVSSIAPPDGSAQADLCARFYPIARNSLLELHPWGFATQTQPLTQLAGAPVVGWGYAYARPADTVRIQKVLAADGTAVPYAVEKNLSGTQSILCNAESAHLRYTALVTDSTQFSQLFTEALTWKLAALLAGPVLKGASGAAEAKSCLAMMQAFFSRAAESDASQQSISAEYRPMSFSSARLYPDVRQAGTWPQYAH